MKYLYNASAIKNEQKSAFSVLNSEGLGNIKPLRQALMHLENNGHFSCPIATHEEQDIRDLCAMIKMAEQYAEHFFPSQKGKHKLPVSVYSALIGHTLMGFYPDTAKEISKDVQKIYEHMKEIDEDVTLITDPKIDPRARFVYMIQGLNTLQSFYRATKNGKTLNYENFHERYQDQVARYKKIVNFGDTPLHIELAEQSKEIDLFINRKQNNSCWFTANVFEKGEKETTDEYIDLFLTSLQTQGCKDAFTLACRFFEDKHPNDLYQAYLSLTQEVTEPVRQFLIHMDDLDLTPYEENIVCGMLLPLMQDKKWKDKASKKFPYLDELYTFISEHNVQTKLQPLSQQIETFLCCKLNYKIADFHLSHKSPLMPAFIQDDYIAFHKWLGESRKHMSCVPDLNREMKQNRNEAIKWYNAVTEMFPDMGLPLVANKNSTSTQTTETQKNTSNIYVLRP